MTAGFVVGEYWSKALQVDVVGVRNDGWIDLGECKWGPTRSPAALERELDQKVQAHPNPQGATIGRRIFTRQPPPEKGRGVGVGWYSLKVYTSDILYREPLKPLI